MIRPAFSGYNKWKKLLWLLPMIAAVNVNAQSYRTKDSTEIIHPKYYISAGMYFPAIATNLRVDSDLGLGTDISLEDDLKLRSNLSVFRLDGLIQVSKRSQVAVLFTIMNRSKEYKLQDDITFKDTTFYIDSYLNTKFNTNYFGATWRYALWQKPGWNAGFSVGLRALQLEVGLDAKLNQYSYGREASFIAPAILFGIHGSGYLTDKLLARYSMEYFQIKIAGIKARIIETNFSVQYFVLKNAGIGVGYGSSAYLINEIPFADNFEGRVRYIFSGFQIFLTSRF